MNAKEVFDQEGHKSKYADFDRQMMAVLPNQYDSDDREAVIVAARLLGAQRIIDNGLAFSSSGSEVAWNRSVYWDVANHVPRPALAEGNGGQVHGKRGMSEKRTKRAEACRQLKDNNPSLSYAGVAIKASESLGYEVTEDDVRNDYRDMNWQWERADRIR